MASAKTWEDIEDIFLCPICLNHCKEPKLLPCIHRFCEGCLQQLLQNCQEELKCPACNQNCEVPKNGIEGFKTDFHVKHLLEYVQAQKSLKRDDPQHCIGCSKEENSKGYCFKCMGFLCGSCYNFHCNNPMVQDHRAKVITREDILQHGLTLEEFSSLREAHRCEVHPEKVSELVCVTCDNLPVCVACGTRGKHKDHDVHELNVMANRERQKMEENLSRLDTHQTIAFELPEETEKVEKQLDFNINQMKMKIQSQFQIEEDKIEEALTEMKREVENDMKDIKSTEEMVVRKLKEQMEADIKAVTKNLNRKREEIISKHSAQEKTLMFRLKSIKEQRDEFISKLDSIFERKHAEIDKISEFATKRIARVENYRKSVDSILITNSDWTAAHDLFDLNGAFESLLDEVRKTTPELKTFSDCKLSTESVYISEELETAEGVDLSEIKNLTCVENSSIVATGGQDMFMFKLKDKEIEMATLLVDSTSRYCSALSSIETVTASQQFEVSIVKAENYTIKSQNIKKLIQGWASPTRQIQSLATDVVKRQIYVGTTDRNVFVFDDEINFCHKLLLPKNVTCPRAMTIHDGNLIVCYDTSCGDTDTGISYFEINVDTCKLLFHLEKPNLSEKCDGSWSSFDIHTDKDGFIYAAWGILESGDEYTRCVTQYSQDGQKILATRDMNVVCITTAETDHGEMLLGVSPEGCLAMYRIIRM